VAGSARLTSASAEESEQATARLAQLSSELNGLVSGSAAEPGVPRAGRTTSRR
jgi:hypothetical protein